MFAKQIFPGLNTYFNRYDGAPRYFVQGKGEIRLGKSDFKAQGGEGAVYVKGSAALTRFISILARSIPTAKIEELSVLVQSRHYSPA